MSDTPETTETDAQTEQPAVASIVTIWLEAEPLSFVERLSLASFVRTGARVRLYTFAQIEEPPTGVEICDAGAIVARDDAPASLLKDLFRYRILAAEPGVVFVDIDVMLLAPLEPADGRLFGEESPGCISPDILALPPESPALKALLAFLEEPHPIPPWLPDEAKDALQAAAEAEEPIPPEHLPWGVWGASALTHFLTLSGEAEHAAPPAVYYPIPYRDRRLLTKRRADLSRRITPEARAVHLYGPELRREVLFEQGGWPRYWCWLGAALRSYDLSPRDAPLPDAPPPSDRVWNDGAKPEAKVDATAPLTRAAKPGPPAGKVLIVTTMKNEGPFILEWIAYHRSIGVTDFLIYTNDCDDGTDEMLDLLVAKGIVAEHIDNPYRSLDGVKPQHAALWDSQKRPVTLEADWVIPMDVDEYINIHVGDGKFQDMIDLVPDANMISMTWRLFGNGFVRTFADGFITERFLWSAHPKARKPHQAWGFKTAFKPNGVYRKFGVHRPKGLNPDRAGEIRWYGSTGREMARSYHESGWRASKANWGYGMVSLNHYSLRSSESYLVKRERGRVNHVDRDQGLAYWFRMNHNHERNLTIGNKLPGARAEYDKIIADPDIAAMHAKCVAAHRARIDLLMERPDYRELFETIESKRMKNLSRILDNFGNTIFHEGPHAVPEEFLTQADEMELAGI